MKVRRQLIIRVDPERAADFVPALVSAAADSGWERDNEAEQQASAVLRERITCFKCKHFGPFADLVPESPTSESEKPGESYVTLAIHLDYYTPGKFAVSDVCQRSRQSLSDNDYNALLVDFNNRVVRNLGGELNVACSLSSDQVDFESLMSPPSFLALWGFSTTAGNPKPVVFLADNVNECWNYFLVTIQDESHCLTPELLTRWLIQEEKWPANMAEGLSAQFAFGINLLTYARNRPLT